MKSSRSFCFLQLLLGLLLLLQTSHAKSWANVVRDTVEDPATIKKPEAAEQCKEEKPQQKPQKSKTNSGALDSRRLVHKSLPAGAKEYMVRNVYDGDTLTLVESAQRVRLLGIDTPEIKPPQPFAQEAKAYAKDLCHKKRVYVSFDSKSNEKEDKYGRWLAMIWVEHPEGGYICVNEGLVANGLATVYLARKENSFSTFNQFVVWQKKARIAKRGMWHSFVDANVVATKNGSAFHKTSCEHIRTARHLRKLKVSQASDLGLHPCRSCHE